MKRSTWAWSSVKDVLSPLRYMVRAGRPDGALDAGSTPALRRSRRRRAAFEGMLWAMPRWARKRRRRHRGRGRSATACRRARGGLVADALRTPPRFREEIQLRQCRGGAGGGGCMSLFRDAAAQHGGGAVLQDHYDITMDTAAQHAGRRRAISASTSWSSTVMDIRRDRPRRACGGGLSAGGGHRGRRRTAGGPSATPRTMACSTRLVDAAIRRSARAARHQRISAWSSAT